MLKVGCKIRFKDNGWVAEVTSIGNNGFSVDYGTWQQTVLFDMFTEGQDYEVIND